MSELELEVLREIANVATQINNDADHTGDPFRYKVRAVLLHRMDALLERLDGVLKGVG